ncbi:putative serine protease 42, partial [Ylistrum balloti]|uniref:putative serine protease 42 n=1 Tax=Ylistrum balloti TaxID=509963 RepID=UPI002905BA23
MEVWMLSLVISGCLALPGIPTPHHPGQELIDLAIQTNLKGQTRIIGGTDAYINDFPWQASLEFNGQHICGAIILSTEFILTAAHCMGSDTWNYKVHVGSSSLSSTGGSRHSVSAAVLHEHFVNSGSTTNGAFPNDVALIKLSEPIDFTSNKQPIDLTSLTNNNLASNDDCWITGWGRTSGNSN